MRLVIAIIVIGLLLWHLVYVHKLETRLNTLKAALRSIQIQAWQSLLVDEGERIRTAQRIAVDAGNSLRDAEFASDLPSDHEEAVGQLISRDSASELNSRPPAG